MMRERMLRRHEATSNLYVQFESVLFRLQNYCRLKPELPDDGTRSPSISQTS